MMLMIRLVIMMMVPCVSALSVKVLVFCGLGEANSFRGGRCPLVMGQRGMEGFPETLS